MKIFLTVISLVLILGFAILGRTYIGPDWVWEVFALLMAGIWVWRVRANPPPMPFAPSPLGDRGHSVYVCANDRVRMYIASLLRESGLKEQGTMTVGFTNQQVFADGVVLMISENPDILQAGTVFDENAVPGAVRSLNIPDRKEWAAYLKDVLEADGFGVSIKEGMLPGEPDKFIMVTSNAFVGGWGLALRAWGPKMGKPEKWIPA